MGAYERAYELFAEKSKARVSEQLFLDKNQQADRQDPVAYTDYSFPTVKIEGDSATIQVVRSFSYEREEGQERITQETALEDEDWRILMRDEQYKFFGG